MVDEFAIELFAEQRRFTLSAWSGDQRYFDRLTIIELATLCTLYPMVD